MEKSNHTSCLICGSKKLSQVEVINQESLVSCTDCSFVFFHRIPSLQELDDHYSGYGQNFVCSPLTIVRYNELLDKMEAFRKTNKILDVGCGAGFFLEQAKKRGWEVYGTEFSDLSMQNCISRGINMHQGVLQIENYKPEMFDVVTSFEVIEHINNPLEELAKFHALVRQKGLVYVTTPNYKYFFKDSPRFRKIIGFPEHLSYYTPKTLNFVFKKQGFKRIKIQTTGIVFSDYKNKPIQAGVKMKELHKEKEQMREKIENNFFLQFSKNMINRVLSFFGVGENLKGWFIKL